MPGLCCPPRTVSPDVAFSGWERGGRREWRVNGKERRREVEEGVRREGRDGEEGGGGRGRVVGLPHHPRLGPRGAAAAGDQTTW